ncbi:MAG: DUF4443 domain-containing protein [Candidatus Asgardarchaeia archaeon]
MKITNDLEEFLIFSKSIEKRIPRVRPYIALQMLFEIGKERKVGRYTLSKRLNLEESTTRTLLNYLRKYEYISSKAKSGHYLSSRGAKVFNGLNKIIVQLKRVEDLEDFTFAKHAFGVVLNNFVERIRKGLEERDEAIKAGARGITLITCKDGVISIPGVYEKLDKASSEKIKNQFNLSNDCILLITSADTEDAAKRAIFAVIYYLLIREAELN